MHGAAERSSAVEGKSFDAARAYGEAGMRSILAFGRAGARSGTAFFDAGGGRRGLGRTQSSAMRVGRRLRPSRLRAEPAITHGTTVRRPNVTPEMSRS